jgi:hypothetical protein
LREGAGISRVEVELADGEGIELEECEVVGDCGARGEVRDRLRSWCDETELIKGDLPDTVGDEDHGTVDAGRRVRRDEDYLGTQFGNAGERWDVAGGVDPRSVEEDGDDRSRRRERIGTGRGGGEDPDAVSGAADADDSHQGPVKPHAADRRQLTGLAADRALCGPEEGRQRLAACGGELAVQSSVRLRGA